MQQRSRPALLSPRVTTVTTAVAMSLAFAAVASLPAESAPVGVATKAPSRAADRLAANDHLASKKRGSGETTVPVPVLHYKGMSHGGDAGSGVMLEETWRDYAVPPRWHFTYTSKSPRIRSMEEWDSPEIDILARGDLSSPLAKRVKAGRSICRGASADGEAAPVTPPSYVAENVKGELLPRQYIEKLRHDPKARAALPAGPKLRGRSTVTWTTDQMTIDDSGFHSPWSRFYLDADTGDVLREAFNKDVPEAWFDYTTWELLPAGKARDSLIAPPAAAIKASGCK